MHYQVFFSSYKVDNLYIGLLLMKIQAILCPFSADDDTTAQKQFAVMLCVALIISNVSQGSLTSSSLIQLIMMSMVVYFKDFNDSSFILLKARNICQGRSEPFDSRVSKNKSFSIFCRLARIVF